MCCSGCSRKRGSAGSLGCCAVRCLRGTVCCRCGHSRVAWCGGRGCSSGGHRRSGLRGLSRRLGGGLLHSRLSSGGPAGFGGLALGRFLAGRSHVLNVCRRVGRSRRCRGGLTRGGCIARMARGRCIARIAGVGRVGRNSALAGFGLACRFADRGLFRTARGLDHVGESALAGAVRVALTAACIAGRPAGRAGAIDRGRRVGAPGRLAVGKPDCMSGPSCSCGAIRAWLADPVARGVPVSI